MTNPDPVIIDTHCHLTSSDLFGNWQSMVETARSAGVLQMITVACRAEEGRRALQIHQTHPGVFVAAGIHPHEAGRVDDDEIAAVCASWSAPGIVAAGEMGLDFHYDFSPRDTQARVFEMQLEAAVPHDLPIVIHSREAHEHVVALLEKHGYINRKVVFHCFSGTAAEAADIRSHGWRTSFTGLITFKNASGPQQALIDAPLDQLMFETDSPYLSPEPVRKVRPNQPAHLVHTVGFAAMLRGLPFEKMASLSTENARAFFKLPS